ncbi:hypothetical protein [Aquimarina litoralis]|uniref:hypothetical protein n=1 Tax=Aquimarina litoralis TaxID=584605 RepID=UPI001C563BD2|nr:hypothetical protein [Aquimarina litoralis]MBW1296267.1 hypothetical protein [Aquimarina litoralis]
MKQIATNFFGKKEDFVMFLPGGVPLISYNSEFQVTGLGDTVALQVSTTLDKVSMKNLIDEKLFPNIEIPEIKPLTKYELRLDLKGSDSLNNLLFKGMQQALEKDPIQILTERKDTSIPPFRQLSNYRLDSWAIIETPLASQEFIDLANKPPEK